MDLVVFSHKRCWHSPASPSGYATHGGFPIQMEALSKLFDTTTLVLPYGQAPGHTGELPLTGHNLTVVPLTFLTGQGLERKLRFPLWFLRNLPTMLRQAFLAGAVHTPIPGDIGTAGMFLALLLRKPLFVRHCGNWLRTTTVAQRFWKWFMERFANEQNIMLATGGSSEPPSTRNERIQWIFSTSLTEHELSRYRNIRTLEMPVRLIIVCRQEEYKGTHLLIESLALIQKQYPAVSLDVVGEGSALNHFKQLTQELGLYESIQFHGKVDHRQVMHLLQEADLFCYPTMASEGFPKVVLEALASGLPVVTTGVSVLPKLLDSECGILLNGAAPTEIARAVVEILADPERYGEMSQRATEIAQQYTLERWQAEIAEALRQGWGPLRTNA